MKVYASTECCQYTQIKDFTQITISVLSSISVAERENVSPIRLILKKTTLNWTRLQCVIAAEDLTVYKVYISIRHAGAKNVRI